jgi:hypothetical protein
VALIVQLVTPVPMMAEGDAGERKRRLSGSGPLNSGMLFFYLCNALLVGLFLFYVLEFVVSSPIVFIFVRCLHLRLLSSSSSVAFSLPGWKPPSESDAALQSLKRGKKSQADIRRDEKGELLFPLVIGGVLTIECLGDIVTGEACANFHSDKYIWPLGYAGLA